MKKSKFLPLYETIYTRYKQGGGFLEGDVVKLKKDYKSTEGYKSVADSVRLRLEDASKSGYNLRVGRLHTNGAQFGAFGLISMPATHCDLYEEPAPGRFGNLVTIPIDLIEFVDTGANLPPVSDNSKDNKDRVQIDPAKEKDIKDEATDDQTKLRDKQTRVKKGNYDLATKNVVPLKGNKYDDSKPSKFKPLSLNEGRISNAEVKAMEDIYTSILNESDESDETDEKILDEVQVPTKPASDGQKAYMKKHGIEFSDDISFGAAQKKIDDYKNGAPDELAD